MSSFKIHKTTIELHNLEELAEALEIMSDESYNHHVNEKKNDFAIWVNDVIKNKELSDKLAGITNRRKALVAIKNYLKKQRPEYAKRLASKLFYIGLAVGTALGIILTIFAIRIIAAYVYFR
ncbi:MAG: hypothetical protein MAG795_00928 [Candidatus Woesearchaeota archaeon]|nr:hypothetical protein [Candidatus Woesearchaeota archaeon]